MSVRIRVESDGATLAVMDHGGHGPTVVLLHGLAGSSREMLPTADALVDEFRVILIDQRGHGLSTRRPQDLTRAAFVHDVSTVVERLAPGKPVSLVGQSMGAHTAFLAAAARPDLVKRVVMLEGHAASSDRPEDAVELGEYFASWPVPFSDEATAREFLGNSSISEAWIRDLAQTADGLRPRFEADVMQQTIAAVHEPRWREWETLRVPVLAAFAEHGMFSEEQKSELIDRAPNARRADIPGASHDAHLDAFDEWIAILRSYLLEA